MKLRTRFVLTLLVIAVILSAPAIYGVFALRELNQVAVNLSHRDAVGALTLGRLQTAFREMDNAERIYLALATTNEAERAEAAARVRAAAAAAEAALRRISEGGYEQAAAPAREAWADVVAAVTREQQLVEAGAIDAADEYREQAVDPALDAMDAALDPIGVAINEAGQAQVDRAQTVSATARTTILLALGVALALALGIGGWLVREFLQPIQRLREATAVVAQGDFESDLRIPQHRSDEIGDLARSFRWMTAQLAELERLRAQFVAVASHELKTPLNVIQGYVSLIEEGIYGDVPEEQRKVLRSVKEQSDRLFRLIQQLLDVSRFEAGGGRIEPQTIRFEKFFGELVTSFEALAVQNDIDFSVDRSDDLPESFRGDPDRLNEVFGNLLSNAFKFTPRGGQIRLAARRAEETDGEGMLVEVSDSGVGIPEDELPNIFEKFYQVENQAQPLSVGSGLGLAIAREIVEAHGGTIAAESRVGDGTTFRVFIPFVPVVPEHDHSATSQRKG